MNHPHKIFIHCSASPNDNSRIDASDIDRWHRERGFRKIGYHYVITRAGQIQAGRAENEIGAHARGHNTGSIGICLIGTDKFTEDQYKSLFDLIDSICIRHNIDLDRVHGHYEVANKICPGIDMTLLKLAIKMNRMAEK